MTIDLHPAGDPSSRGWGPGWPRGQGTRMVPLVVGSVPVVGGVRGEIHELALALATETERRGYGFRTPGCWGYDNRPIAGTNVPSLHSWGLAIDINAPANPRLSHLVTDMPTWMPDLWNAYGFRWGGDYAAPTPKDPMHYEFMGTPADAAAMTMQARKLAQPAPQPAPTHPEATMFMYLSHTGRAVLVGASATPKILAPVLANALSPGLKAAGLYLTDPKVVTSAFEAEIATTFGTPA